MGREHFTAAEVFHAALMAAGSLSRPRMAWMLFLENRRFPLRSVSAAFTIHRYVRQQLAAGKL